eukprot:8435177-Alexandrium_andersonii.AAC.1
MEEHVARKVEGRLGGSAGQLREVRLLSRVIRWTPEGLLYEAGPRHAREAGVLPGLRAGPCGRVVG